MIDRDGPKAIETSYAGCRFRSRLEARWAVFFDQVGIKWEYEPEGFEIGSMHDDPPRNYLPDFYLPSTSTWVEVKPTDGLLDKGLMVRCVDTWSNGLPYIDASQNTLSSGLLLLGDIPRPSTIGLLPVVTILGHHKGVFHRYAAPVANELTGEVAFERIDGSDNWCCMDVTIGNGDDVLNGCTCTWVNVGRGLQGCRDQQHLRRVFAALTAARSARFGT